MKEIGIVGNGEPCQLPLHLQYIACDGGFNTLQKQGIKPIAVIGDFDSIDGQIPLEAIVLPTIKDVTDTHAAIDFALLQGYDLIHLYGVTGGRLDHFYAAIVLLSHYRNSQIIIHNDYNRIRLLKKGAFEVRKDSFTYYSFYALNQCQISLRGFKYPLNDYCLNYSDPLCTSNELVSDLGTIITSDDLLMFEAK